MKIVIQRVSQAGINELRIGKGIVLLIGFDKTDDKSKIGVATSKIINLRIFEDQNGKMNLSCLDMKGEILTVPNFTLSADIKSGLRPSFSEGALSKEKAKELFEEFVKSLNASGLKTLAGKFGEHMDVNIQNNGPVTFFLEI